MCGELRRRRRRRRRCLKHLVQLGVSVSGYGDPLVFIGSRPRVNAVFTVVQSPVESAYEAAAAEAARQARWVSVVVRFQKVIADKSTNVSVLSSVPAGGLGSRR